MAYTTLSEVRNVIPSIQINEQSLPSHAIVTTWLTYVDGQVNLALSESGTTLPLDATADVDLLNALKLICAREVAYQVLTSRGATGSGEGRPYWAGWHEEFMEMLDKIREGSYLKERGVAGGPSSFTMGADPDDTIDEDRKNADIVKGMQW